MNELLPFTIVHFWAFGSQHLHAGQKDVLSCCEVATNQRKPQCATCQLTLVVVDSQTCCVFHVMVTPITVWPRSILISAIPAQSAAHLGSRRRWHSVLDTEHCERAAAGSSSSGGGHALGDWQRPLPQLWLGQHLPAQVDCCKPSCCCCLVLHLCSPSPISFCFGRPYTKTCINYLTESKLYQVLLQQALYQDMH